MMTYCADCCQEFAEDPSDHDCCEKDEATSASSCSLLEWATENIAAMCYQSHPIADTGDFSEQWHVVDHEGSESWGSSYAEAIEQAKMDDNDERRMDYVPPEFR